MHDSDLCRHCLSLLKSIVFIALLSNVNSIDGQTTRDSEHACVANHASQLEKFIETFSRTSSWERESVQLHQEVETLKLEAKLYRDQVQRLLQTIQSQQEQLGDLIRSDLEVQANKTQFQLELQEQREEIRNLKTSIGILQEHNVAKQTRLEMTDECAKNSSTNPQLDQKLLEHQHEINNLKSILNQTKTESKLHQDLVQTLLQTIQSQQAQLGNLMRNELERNSNLTTVDQQLREHEREAENMKSALSQSKDEIQGLKTTVRFMQEQNTAQQMQIGNLMQESVAVVQYFTNRNNSLQSEQEDGEYIWNYI